MSDGEFQIIPDEHLMWPGGSPGIWKTKTKVMTGVEKIAQKRLDQKIKHGHSIRSDYESYPDYELMTAAQAILTGDPEMMPDSWDRATSIRLCSKSLEDRLITAGAMLAAQIDVLNFTE